MIGGSIFRKHFKIFKLSRLSHFIHENPKILVTGGLGHIGRGLANELRNIYGKDQVIISDVVQPSEEDLKTGPFLSADVGDYTSLEHIIVNHNVNWLINLAALPRSAGEENIPLALKVNIQGVHNILALANEHKIRVFMPSTIGTFGPDSPRNLTPNPNVIIQKPRTIYDISKVHAEILGEYYHHKFGLDFRCLRFPGIVSSAPSSDATTDYATTVLQHALLSKNYNSYLKPNTRLPMMYIDDCIRAIVIFMSSSNTVLRRRTYNVSGVSFTPHELHEEIRLHIPEFSITYKPDEKQSIAETWPEMLDDTAARTDWNWVHLYNLNDIVTAMLQDVHHDYSK